MPGDHSPATHCPPLALVLLPLLAVTAASSAASSPGGAPLFTPLTGFRPGAGELVRVRPEEFRAYRVDLAGVRAALSGGGTRTIDIPAPTGEVGTFRVTEDSVMEPALQAAHPDMRTYSGRGPAGSTIRLDVTPMGFHAFVRHPDGRTWYVDPAENRVDEDRVLSYFSGAVPAASKAFVERELKRHDRPAVGTGDEEVAPSPGGIVSTRTYRVAFLTDKSYADDFGNADVSVMAEKTTMLNRVNEVYNDDLAIKFVMVTGTDTKLNFNTDAEQTGPNGPCGASACFTAGQLAGCGGATLDRNEFVLGQVIGAENYDIGHIGLGVDGGGIAGLGVVGGPFKADGCTGLPTPTGDFYAIDYVAHEVGHQMGGDHTFNGSGELLARQPQHRAVDTRSSRARARRSWRTPASARGQPPAALGPLLLLRAASTRSTRPPRPLRATRTRRQVVNFTGLDIGEQITISCSCCPSADGHSDRQPGAPTRPT